MRLAITSFLMVLMTGPMLAGEWEPPKNPNPDKILDEAVEDTNEGRYEEALAKHVWFHRHALEHDESQVGVRLSFALSYWIELGEKYPPALEKFKSIRDATEKRFYHVKEAVAIFKSFMDLAAMNGKLGAEERTVKAFGYLHENNRKTAKQVYEIAEPSLIATKKYQLAGDYLSPEASWARIVGSLRRSQKMAEDRDFGESFRKYINKSFINDTATLVALLVVNDRKDEAEKIAKAARNESLDEQFQDEFNKTLKQALEGTVPKPWP